MTTLTLVVNVLDQCKQGVCFPEAQSVWPREELIKVLNLSGIVGPLPSRYTYEHIIQIFLDHLNVQTPKVYALHTERELILDSSTVQVRHNLVHLGPYARLQAIEPSSLSDCRHLWQVFYQHVRADSSRDLQYPRDSPEVLAKQMRIVELEKEVTKLKKQAQESETGRIKTEFQEAQQVMKALEAQIREERQRVVQLRDKNLALARESQVLEARAMELREQLQRVRTKLSLPSQTPEALDAALDELTTLKQQLQDCQRQRHKT